MPTGRPGSPAAPQDAVVVTFYSDNPIYQAQDGRPYTITVSDSSGRPVYRRSGTTIEVVASDGGDRHEWTSAAFVARSGMDPSIKILHGAYTRRK